MKQKPTITTVERAGTRAGVAEVHIHFDGPTYGLNDLDERIRQGAVRASAQMYPRIQYGWTGA